MFNTRDTLLHQAAGDTGSVSIETISHLLVHTLRQTMPDLTDQHYLSDYPHALLDHLVAQINAAHDLHLSTTMVREAGTIAVVSTHLYHALHDQPS